MGSKLKIKGTLHLSIEGPEKDVIAYVKKLKKDKTLKKLNVTVDVERVEDNAEAPGL